jgi:RHS repeat-associated protein
MLRTDAGGPSTFLTDALGSTVVLTDSAGDVQTQYTYEPFGATSTTGGATGNSIDYTGRESDSTGLKYYRARYYHPQLQRFISEDPLRFASGDVNFYAYIGNRPTSFVDPLGLCADPAGPGIRYCADRYIPTFLALEWWAGCSWAIIAAPNLTVTAAFESATWSLELVSASGWATHTAWSRHSGRPGSVEAVEVV